jgi:hypothetical protein
MRMLQRDSAVQRGNGEIDSLTSDIAVAFDLTNSLKTPRAHEMMGQLQDRDRGCIRGC